MGSRILSFLAIMVLVAGCSSQNKDAASMATDGAMNSNVTASPAPVDTMGGPTPGSQQDLVVNVGDRVFFDYDKSDLKPAARATSARRRSP